METLGPVLCRVIRGLWSSSAVQPLVNTKFTLGPGRREGDREGQDNGGSWRDVVPQGGGRPAGGEMVGGDWALGAWPREFQAELRGLG